MESEVFEELEELERLLNDKESLQKFQALVRDIGMAGIEAVFKHFGGSRPYVPTLSSLRRFKGQKKRDAEVVNRFNGRNYGELAMEFYCSTDTIRRILRRELIKKRKGVK